MWYLSATMAFAVIETGGKQYRIKEGDSVTIEKLTGVSEVGEKVVFDKVLLLDDEKTTKVGTPYLDGVNVEAELTQVGKGKKILVRTFKRKTGYMRRLGHRQPQMKAKVAKMI